MANTIETDEKILIGIYIGSSSASAAFRLSSQPTVTSVIWSRGRTTVPLFITSKGDGDEANLKFGYDADPFDSNKGFALRVWLEEKSFWDDHPPVEIIAEELHRKRGKYYYCPINWKGPDDKRCFELFLSFMKTHIERVLRKTYPGTAMMSLQREYCFAVPPFVPDWSVGGCVSIISGIFDCPTHTCSFMPQPHASLLTLDQKEVERLRDADLLIACHMEEAITSITHFQVETNFDASTPTLRYSGQKTCAIGSDDLGDYIRKYAYVELVSRWAQNDQDMASASTISRELAKMRDKFLDNLNEVDCGGNEEDLRIKQMPRFLGNNLAITSRCLRFTIFTPILSAIGLSISKLIDSYPSKERFKIMLSGHLAECPSTHTVLINLMSSYVELRTRRGKDRIDIQCLHTKDEAISPSIGASTPKNGWGNIYQDYAFEERLVDGCQHIPLPFHSRDGGFESMVRLMAIQPAFGNSTDVRTTPNPRKLMVVAEILLQDIVLRQGVMSETVHHFYPHLFSLFERMQDKESIRGILSALYIKEMRSTLSVTDVKRDLPALHLAAAICHSSVIKSLLLGNAAAKDERVSSNLALQNFTPLELRVWLFNGEEDMSVVRLLLGNDLRHATRIAARRGFKSLLELLEKHSPQKFRRDCPTLIRLAILGQHTELSQWLLTINPLFWSETQPTQVRDPCNQRVYRLSEIDIPRQFTRKLSYRDLRRESSINVLAQISETTEVVDKGLKDIKIKTDLQEKKIRKRLTNRLREEQTMIGGVISEEVEVSSAKKVKGRAKSSTDHHETQAASPPAKSFSQRKQPQPLPLPSANIYTQGGAFLSSFPQGTDGIHILPRNHLDNSDFSQESLKRADAIISSLPEPGLRRGIDFGNWAMEYYYSMVREKTNTLESRSRTLKDAKQCLDDLKRSTQWQQPYLFCSHSSCAQDQSSDIEDDGKTYREFCYGPNPQLRKILALGVLGHSSVRESPALKYGELCSSCKHHWTQHVYKRWHTVRESDLKILEEVQDRIEMLELRIGKLQDFISILEKKSAEQESDMVRVRGMRTED